MNGKSAGNWSFKRGLCPEKQQQQKTEGSENGKKSLDTLIYPFQKNLCISENLEAFALHGQSEASDSLPCRCIFQVEFQGTSQKEEKQFKRMK